MLVLTRRLNEEICIPTLGITICVSRIGKSVVALAVNAPPNIHVLRSELLGTVIDSLEQPKQVARPTDLTAVKIATRTLAPRRFASGMAMQATSRVAR